MDHDEVLHETSNDESLVPQQSPLRHPDIEREWIIRGIEQLRLYQKAENHLSEALQALHEKRYLEAIGFFRKALAEHPEHPEVHFFLGITHFLLGQYPEATSCYQETTALDAAHYGAYIQLGVVQHLLQNYAEAIEAYQHAIKLNPELSEAYVRLGNTYAAAGRRKEAVAAYADALRARLTAHSEENESHCGAT